MTDVENHCSSQAVGKGIFISKSPPNANDHDSQEEQEKEEFGRLHELPGEI